jgi:CheY-like chemotaxis protein
MLSRYEEAGQPKLFALSESTLSGLRILVVEDDEDGRDTIVKILEMFGASVAGVATADDGLRVIGLMKPDVLVSDIGLPGRDGLWLIREVRRDERVRAIPAIAVTARVSSDDRRVILAAGFQAHVPKPFDFDDLIATIRRVVGASRAGAGC